MRYSRDFTFIDFLKKYNLKEIENILDDEPELFEFIDKDKNSLISVAVENGDLELVKFLISKGADLDVVNGEGKTPLIIAVNNRSEDIINALLENRAEVNKRNDTSESPRYKYTPLMYAAYAGYSKGVEILLKNKAKINEKDNEWCTALMIAVIMNYEETINELLKADEINVNIQDIRGKTALIYAVDNNAIGVIHSLLSKKAEVDIQDREGRTALFYAMRAGSIDIIDLLIKNGADLNHIDNEGSTVLFYTVNDDYLEGKKQQQYEIILMLKERRIDIYIKNKYDISAFELAPPKIKKLLDVNYELSEVQELPEDECPDISRKIVRETISRFLNALKKEPFNEIKRSKSLDKTVVFGNHTGRTTTWAHSVKAIREKTAEHAGK